MGGIVGIARRLILECAGYKISKHALLQLSTVLIIF